MSPCNMLLFLFFHLGSVSSHIALYRTVTEQPICSGPTGPAGIFAFHFHFHKYSKTFRSYNESERVGQEKMTSHPAVPIGLVPFLYSGLHSHLQGTELGFTWKH